MSEQHQEHEELIVPLRLQKFLARSGVASRRGSETLMTAGRVRVNGEVVTELGSKVDPLQDTVEVDGKVVSFGQEKVYIALNKPTGYVTTMSDPYGRPTVAELVPSDLYPGLFPIGRLDLDTSGLLLFTTDGELAHRVLHPKHKVAKRYCVTAEGVLSQKSAETLRKGIVLEDGPTAPAKIVIDSTDESTSWVTCIITEGRKRQVRRMFKALSHHVVALHRDAFGPIELGDQKEGEWRLLTPQEIELLKEAVF